MERLVVFGAMLVFVSFWPTSAQQSVDTVVIDDGRVGIGLITGGNFGPGSFSINGSPSGLPKTHIYVQEDDGGTQHIIIQSGQSDSIESGNSEGGNTQLYPVTSLTIHKNPGGNGQITIDSVVLNTQKRGHNKSNKQKNDNIQPDDLDAAALNAIFGSNSGNNGPSNVENDFSNIGEQGSLQIASITGSNFEEGTLNINNNKSPDTDVHQSGSSVNNGNPEKNITENEAQDFLGHGGNIQPGELDAAALEAIFGSKGENKGLTNTGNGLSKIEKQGGTQIASITGGNFEEGTLNIYNNNRPETRLPQNGSAVNNGNPEKHITENEAQVSLGHGGNIQPGELDAVALEAIFGSNGENKGPTNTGNEISLPQNGNAVNNGNTGNLNTENEAQYPIGHGANKNGNTVGVGSNQGQTSSSYNTGGYDEPWIWNR